MASNPFPQYEVLTWLTAIGPTIATLAAVGVTIWSTLVARRVSRDAAELQKRLSGPRINVLERTRITQESWREWLVEITNDGETVGSVQEFRVFVDGELAERLPFQDPPIYWLSVFERIDLGPCGYIDASALAPPVSVSADSQLNLFSVLMTGTNEQIERAMRRLRLEIEYVSVWGERFLVVHDFGGFRHLHLTRIEQVHRSRDRR